MTVQATAQPNQQSWKPIVFSVVGAVCAALITTALGAQPGLNLIGAALAAAIPPVISAAGPRPSLRVTAAVVVTAVSVLFTYGGFTLFAYAARQPSAFPLPPGAALPSTSAPPTSTTTRPSTGLGIKISPDEPLHCNTHRCAEQVTITSTGTIPLVIAKIEFDGENAADFLQVGDCESRELPANKSCVLTVRFNPSGSGRTRHARLVVNQNLPGPPSYLKLEGEPSKLPDLTASSEGARCDLLRVNSRDVLQVRFPILLASTDTSESQQTVRVTANSPSGLAADYRSGVSTTTHPALSTVTFFVRPAQFGGTHQIIVTVDAGNEVVESNEKNNQMRVNVKLPGASSPPGKAICSFP